MSKILVTITGMPRTGKDAYISACAAQWKDEVYIVRAISSINVMRRFVQECREKLGLNVPEEPEERDRKSMARIKEVMDEHFNWTAGYIVQQIADLRMPDQLVFYQVREPANLHKIAALAKVNGIEFVPVYIKRSDRPDTPMAHTDGVTELDFPFELIVDTTPQRWEQLGQEFAAFIKERYP